MPLRSLVFTPWCGVFDLLLVAEGPLKLKFGAVDTYIRESRGGR